MKRPIKSPETKATQAGPETHKTPATTALRFNGGKPQFSMVLEFPGALTELARVCAFGALKYERLNWRGTFSPQVLIDSAVRHLIALNNGEIHDPETNLQHAAHAAWNCLVLAEQLAAHPLVYDNPEGVQQMTRDRLNAPEPE